MSNVALLIASIALFSFAGLAVWLWFAMLRADDESRMQEHEQGMSVGR